MKRFFPAFLRFCTAGFSRLKKNAAEFSRKTPCGVMALGVICVLLPQFLFPDRILLQSILPALFLLLAGALLPLFDTVWKFALPGLLAGTSLFFRQEMLQRDPLRDFAGDREQIGIVAVVRAEDSSLFGKTALLPDPERVRCTLLSGAYSSSGKMQELGSKVILRLPKGFSRGLACGDILQVSGRLKKPSRPLLPGSFDYRAYLQKQGISYVLYADEVRHCGRKFTFSGALLDLRNAFAGKVFSPLPERNRSFAAALLFGCSQNVERTTKEDLIRTGTIHILTVSGLHIGFFAAFIALCCMVFPFRTRMFLIPFLTFFYAWMSGLNMPALRALLMLGACCFARGCFLDSSAKNSLFFAFVLLMCLYPMQFADAGMLYSFLTTFSLLLASENIPLWGRSMNERSFFVPANAVSGRERLLRKGKYTLFRVFAGCCAAWGGSCALTLHYQGIAAPFSVMVNFLFVPLVWLCFPVFFLGSILARLLPFAGKCTAFLLKLLTDLLLFISNFAARKSDLVLPRPGVVPTVLFLFFLFLLLGEKTRRNVVLFAVAGLLSTVLCFSGKLFPPDPELLVLAGGGREKPCIIVSVPEYDYAFLMDAADFETASAAGDFLRSRGHGKIDTLVSSTGKGISSLRYLFRTLKAENLILAERSQRRNFASSLRELGEGGNTLVSGPEEFRDAFTGVTVSAKKIREIRITCFRVRLRLAFFPDRITLLQEGKGSPREIMLPHARETIVFSFPLAL